MSLETAHTPEIDPIARTLQQYAQNILVVVFGLLPLFFFPTAYAPFEYTKIFFVVVGLLASLVLYSLSVLRSGKIQVKFSYTLLALWGVVIVSCISALLSGDLRDAFIGDSLSIHTAAFVGILALTVSVWSMLSIEKATVMRLYMVLAASTLILVIYHVIRLIGGAEVFSFNVFTSLIATPIGSWNDLALFLGLSVLLSLVALEQLPLTRPGKLLFGFVTVLSLVMLAVINFFIVWVVLGLVSLVMLVYTLGKGRFSAPQMSLISEKTKSASSLPLALVVFVVSVLFIIGGATIGGFISKYTNISYVEVRPSLEATSNIARQVYGENAILGIGTNKFVDAWRMYKDPAINSTIFWNTEFNAGNGYITTFFVTAGVLGGLAWIFFLVLFTVSGVRFLLTASDADRMWYFIGLSSFVSAIYIWGMSVIYVPGAVILLLGALCTGIALASRSALGKGMQRTFSIITNRRAGFVLTLVVIAMIVGSVSVLYVSGQHYSAAYGFNKSMVSFQNGADVTAVSSELDRIYQLSKNDLYARRVAEVELTKLNRMLSLTNPTSEEQKVFENALVQGVNAATIATQVDPTEPANWNILGAIYNVLITTNKESVYDLANNALLKARDLDPRNPLAYLSLAVFEARAGNIDAARKYAGEALSLKPNYTDAVFFISQLDIAAGDIEAAIRSTSAMISLEPNNPARYYQLGVLESARKNAAGAAVAFERAVLLNPDFANARYLLAFAYDALNRPLDARAQLERVQELNPDNTEVKALLETLRTENSLGGSTVPDGGQGINEEDGVREEGDAVVTDSDPDSALVKPVNTAPLTEEDERGQ